MLNNSKLMTAIVILNQEYIDQGITPQQINNGYCEDFAEEISNRLGREFADTLSVLDIANFIQIDPETGCAYDTGGPFDLELLEKHWTKIIPPEGLTWNDMNEISEFCGFSAGTHVFLHYGDKFYDSEAMNGVDTPFELPFFQRVIASWIAERNPLPKI